MPTEPTVQVAMVGIVATFVTVLGAILTAVINNRKERQGAAEEGMEAALRERIVLRDEQLLALREENERLHLRLEEAQENMILKEGGRG